MYGTRPVGPGLHWRPDRFSRLVTFLLLAVILAGSALPLAPAQIAWAQETPAEPVAPAAVTDTPENFVTDTHNAFFVANGMAYWSWYCPLFIITAASTDGGQAAAASAAVEPAGVQAPPDPAFLKRKPLSGGSQSTVAFTNSSRSVCTTYYMPTVDGDGVYYYVKAGTNLGSDPLRIEFRPGGGSGTPVVVANVNNATAPNFNDSNERFGTDASFVYWATVSGTVLRARKDGTSAAPELAADGLTNPRDVLVVGSSLFIAADNGIFRIGTGTCPQPAGPCAETRLSNVGGRDLAYRVSSGGGVIKLPVEQVYWVNDETIQRWSCLTIININCTVNNEIVHNRNTGDGLNWSIGRPAFSGNFMFWQEGHGGDLNSGAVRRKDISNLANSVDTIADLLYFVGKPVFVEGGNVYFSDFQNVDYFIKRLSVLATPITRDLTASGVEVTQGIQNLANGAPLAAKKTTYVRAYATNALGPRANAVQARLYGTRNGTPLPGTFLLPVNGTRSLVQGVTFDRARLDDGWLFQLPSSWVNTPGALSLRLVVDPNLIYADPNRGNNEMTANVNLQSQPPACAIFVPVDTHEPTTSTSMPNFWDMVGRFRRLWPMPSMLTYSTDWQAQETEVCWWGPFPHPCGGPFELNEGASISDWIPDKDEAIAQLWLYNLVHYAPACDDAGAYTHVMGMVHPQAPTGSTLGYASTISGESWVKLPPASPNPFPNTFNAMIQSGVMAQELSHNFGRKHINCGSPGDIDTGFPYPNPCQLAPTGQTSYYGFDSKTLTPIRPDGAKDFMTYSTPYWVSDYTWRAVMNAVAASGASAASPDASLVVSANGSVVATGHVDTQKVLGRLNSIKVLPDGAITPSMLEKLVSVAVSDYHETGAADADHGGEPHASNIHVRLLDAEGNVLADKQVTLLPIDDHDTTATAQVFLASFPAPAGQVRRIQLLDGATLLDEKAPGASAPVLTISEPAGGSTVQEAITVKWQGSDPDLDPLIFNIQYSYDGGVNWQALAGEIPDHPDPNYQYTFSNLSGLHGSAANAARVRVIATDGYNTTIATSQPFTLADRRPVAFITDPAAGQIFDPQMAVGLHGGATDGEDGALEGNSLVWSIGATPVATDTDALIGGLAPGVYTATLSAKDSTNKVGTATAPLRIGTLSIPQSSAAVMDGNCDDAAYTSGAQLLLKPYTDATQASLRLVRDANYLYACFSGLKAGASVPGAFVGLRFDVNLSRNPQAQADDFGFFVGENGGFFTVAGNGAGGFDEPGPGGLQAQISANDAGTFWNAELRIERAKLGGWDRIVGMKAGHYWVGFQGDDYGWPYAAPTVAVFNAPNTWARTALGLVPIIDNLQPLSTTVGGPAFTLTLEGSNISPNAHVLVNGQIFTPTVALASAVQPAAAEMSEEEAAAAEAAALAATTAISVELPSSLLAAPGSLSIQVQNPGPLNSGATSIIVNNVTPAISSLSPGQIKAESDAFVLTVNGSGFVNGAQVIWDGAVLPTTFDSSSKLRAQVSADRLALGRLVGVEVQNPAPTASSSNSASFEIAPNFDLSVFLPNIER